MEINASGEHGLDQPLVAGGDDARSDTDEGRGGAGAGAAGASS